MTQKSKLPRGHLKKKLRRSVLQGHPWLYDKAISLPEGLHAGALLEVHDDKGFLATGFVDPLSPIRFRSLERDRKRRVDGEWISSMVQSSAQRRLNDPRLADTNAIRWIHGEGDGLPGIVVDGYNGVHMVVLDGDGACAFYHGHLKAVASGLRAAGVEVKSLHARKRARKREWLCELPPENVQVVEHGATFEVDLRRGQKTGLFLDQRDNRHLVGQHSAGARVLNLFSYTGGFSLAAALGGASRVTTVDISKGAIENARLNATLSGIDASMHDWIAEDVFAVLETFEKQGREFDVVICDPPSFVSNEKTLVKGLSAYRRLNTLAMKRVVVGGKYFSASCSSHVADHHLMQVVCAAASGQHRRATVFDVRGAASDHPLNPAFPEGRYLSFLACQMD